MTTLRRQYKYNADPANKPKLQARSKVAWAIKSGKLARQSCEKCGDLKSNAHHHDYSKPLEVQWLCSPCHGIEHRPTQCQRGHDLTPENIYLQKSRGTRCCLQCMKDWRREYWKIHKRSEWRISK